MIPAQGRASERRPLLILTNGYDATITDAFFASAVAASRRGYHCLIFDGPGQGTTLIEQGVRLRPDWEAVIKPVVDFALTLPNVDPGRIALSGWSLGGYLSPRAASGESRLAACIADPAQFSIADGFRAYAIKLGATPEQAAHLGELPEALIERMDEIIAHDRKLRWSIYQRGYWVNGASNLRDYLASVEPFTMSGRVENIQCPTLFTLAENDPLTSGTQAFFDALRCPKTLLRFSHAQGAAEHCEMSNRSLLNRKVLDWLDDVL
jgi:alpha-beta hydrolase superfamily lysophospholipase